MSEGCGCDQVAYRLWDLHGYLRWGRFSSVDYDFALAVSIGGGLVARAGRLARLFPQAGTPVLLESEGRDNTDAIAGGGGLRGVGRC